MTADEKRQVRGRVPFDGLKWHSIHKYDDESGIVETCCGETYRISEALISEIGERPSGLSGNSICYNCTSSHAKPQETVDSEEVTA